MARAGDLVSETLVLVGEAIRVGVTTEELDRIAEQHIRARGGTPTFKGYRGYPASICASPNEMVDSPVYCLQPENAVRLRSSLPFKSIITISAPTGRRNSLSPILRRL